MISIIDYRAGNLTSVARALQHLGESCEITGDPRKIQRAERIIFPGVGAAGEAMTHLRSAGLNACIRDVFQAGKPILGICLGTQVIFEYSEEDNATCLGLVPGRVKRFPEGLRQDGRPIKIPHMGWNRVDFTGHHPVFRALPSGSEFYFVHSFYPVPADEKLVAGWSDYGIRFCAVVAYQNLVAVQFHAEKSGRFGLQILKNFCRWEGRDAQ
ncbi:MAG TPA: imidazole glycerol phosphate synthase subunit HisH [Syntrophales bacterium]|nr:imidazole glycerol phosphate synthase subunit HisH [Syntrophales bacterium]HPI58414.1 imidazole glycerol phosphate synthase subunit HisH [Syntrophales bacterium]HPN23759.1 imidazole glycerol phosphate synthase subunit HisH [Syntrophales bacterium]HQM30170.1 imidazole glycerol phosphate synthase subunit HisH [Syntrophales bacterium]